MSSRRSRTRGGAETEPVPPADPPPPEDTERDGDEQDDEPARRDDGTDPNSETGRGAGVASQEAVTAAVLDALSNPDVIRRLRTVISPDGGSSSGSVMVAADGK